MMKSIRTLYIIKENLEEQFSSDQFLLETLRCFCSKELDELELSYHERDCVTS